MERLGKRTADPNQYQEYAEPEVTRKVRIAATGSRKKSVEIEVVHANGNGVALKAVVPVDESIEKGNFDNFRITPKTSALLKKKGINYLFPIQSKTFDIAYDGHDLVGRDRTGSGKTLAYALPIIERFRADGVFSRCDGQPKLLVLVPTRELAVQGKFTLN